MVTHRRYRYEPVRYYRREREHPLVAMTRLLLITAPAFAFMVMVVTITLLVLAVTRLYQAVTR